MSTYENVDYREFADAKKNKLFYNFINYTKEINQCEKMILCKLFHWLLKNDKNFGFFVKKQQWIRNSYASWQKHISIFSISTIRRALAHLEKMQLIESNNFSEGKKFCGGEQVKYFTINFDRLNELLNTSKPFKNKALSTINSNSKAIGEGGHFDHPYISNKTSNLKKYHKKSLINSKSQILQQDGKFKNIFDSDQIQNILSMKQIWNSVVEGKGDEILFEDISKHEQAFLLQALNQYFSNDLNQWKNFCTKITTSSFLMGEKTSFKVSLSWVLKFANLQKILEGSLYGFGDRIPQPFKNLQIKDKTPIACDLQQDVIMDGFVQESLIKQALELRHKILQRVGEGAYNSWFSKARLVLNDRNQYILCVGNTFIKNSIKNRFELDLKGLIEDIFLIGEVESALSNDPKTKVEDKFLEKVLEVSETLDFSEESPQEIFTKNEQCIGSSTLDDSVFVDISLNDPHITLDDSNLIHLVVEREYTVENFNVLENQLANVCIETNLMNIHQIKRERFQQENEDKKFKKKGKCFYKHKNRANIFVDSVMNKAFGFLLINDNKTGP